MGLPGRKDGLIGRIKAFQTCFRPINGQRRIVQNNQCYFLGFQTGFRLLSEGFETGFKLELKTGFRMCSNWISTGNMFGNWLFIAKFPCKWKSNQTPPKIFKNINISMGRRPSTRSKTDQTHAKTNISMGFWPSTRSKREQMPMLTMMMSFKPAWKRCLDYIYICTY